MCFDSHPQQKHVVHPHNDASFVTSLLLMEENKLLQESRGLMRLWQQLCRLAGLGPAPSPRQQRQWYWRKVPPSLAPDIVADNCLIISHLPWRIVPYVCKSVQQVDGARCGGVELGWPLLWRERWIFSCRWRQECIYWSRLYKSLQKAVTWCLSIALRKKKNNPQYFNLRNLILFQGKLILFFFFFLQNFLLKLVRS